jgi:transcriptional regulator with XRE-family HTH domain
MELRHPIDAEIRSRLEKAGVNQVVLAAAIGRSQGWLSRYISGAGKATIDDIVRIAAALIGVGDNALSENERRVVRALRKLKDEDDRLDVLAYAEHRAKLARNARSKESSEPAARTPPVTVRKARGTR